MQFDITFRLHLVNSSSLVSVGFREAFSHSNCGGVSLLDTVVTAPQTLEFLQTPL